MPLIRIRQPMDHRIFHDGLNDELWNQDLLRLRSDLIAEIKLSVKPDLLDLCIAFHQCHLFLQRDKLGA